MKVIAHRGNSSRYPENTMKAFRSAWEVGAYGVELDVRLTADGEVMVFHDADGQRLCRQTVTISQSNWSDITSWRVEGEPIPLLADVLAEAPKSTLTLVELKSGVEMLTPLLRLLSRHDSKNVTLLTFDPIVAAAAALSWPSVWWNLEAYHLDNLSSVIKKAVELKVRGLSCGWGPAMCASIVKRVHSEGLSMAVWTVNDPIIARMAFNWGVDVLMTDDPIRILSEVDHG